ncbi:hypothetical protein BB560_002381 [Smittium megazygosporum]|uniref:RING-type E3 ubiquitin transferase n=1 Tax=Smittium megazygosporum TaxID=133381 RepID=A0A2T9ZEX9_9FUNG|nr:hypothetical protein BB560_002381 [Smittium megazygosporum]
MRYNSFFNLLLVLLILYMFFSNESDKSKKSQKPQKLNQLDIISNFTFANSTGTTGWPHDSLVELEKLYIPESKNPSNLYYRNASGILTGSWSAKTLNETTEWFNGTLQDDYTNFTTWSNGNIYSFVSGKRTKYPLINFVKGYAKLSKELDVEYFSLEGIHLEQNGTFYLYGYKEKHFGVIKKLLNIMPDNTTFSKAKDLLIDSYKSQIDEVIFENDISPTCEFYVFGQLGALGSNISKEQLDQLEEELENPTGEMTIKIPKLTSKLYFFSPNCSAIIKTVNDTNKEGDGYGFVSGPRKQVYENKVVNFAFFAMVIAITQLLTLIHQIEFTPTPSVNSFENIVVYAYYVPPCGSLLVLIVFFIWTFCSNTQGIEDTSSLDSTESVGRLYFIFYVCLMLTMFIVYWYSNIPWTPVLYLIYIIIFVLYSLWVPQIIRNTVRGTIGGLSRRFILITSILRLTYPTYIFHFSENVFFMDSTNLIYVLYIWTLLQVLVLYLQDIFGARFFVPKRFLPETYNYHPVLSNQDEESSLAGSDAIQSEIANSEEPAHVSESLIADPQTTVQAETSTNQGGVKIINKTCAICMQPVDITSSKSKILKRINYMVTPCHHIFHSECLTNVSCANSMFAWMRIKLECPVCRAPLPPI